MSSSFFCLIITLIVVFVIDCINGQPSYPFRPTFHFVPDPPTWMQDPSGLFYDANTGLYHLMPDIIGPLNWGHAISTDLLHWDNLPVAIPNNEPYNAGGVFTGSITIVNGEPMAMYSVSTNNKMCIAYPTDALNDITLTNWTNYPNNCVLNAPKDGPTGRDPITSWTTDNGTTWTFAYATQGPALNGGAVTYQTKDWKTWKRANFLSYSNYTGGWECPDFFLLSKSEQVDGVTHVMKVSKAYEVKDYWAIGGYNEASTEFIPYGGETHNAAWNCTDCVFDYGILYASKSFYDSKNDRQILFGWLREQRNCNNVKWCGAQILPREIKLLAAADSPTGKPRVTTWPIAEFNSLRIESTKYENDSIILSEGEIVFFDNNRIGGNALDISLTWSSGGDCAIWVLSDKSGTNKTRIGVNFKNVPYAGVFYIDSIGYGGTFQQHPVAGWNAVDPISLRIIVDHSIINVFINNGITVSSQRYYPTHTDFRIALNMWDHNVPNNKCVLESFVAWNVSTVIQPPS